MSSRYGNRGMGSKKLGVLLAVMLVAVYIGGVIDGPVGIPFMMVGGFVAGYLHDRLSI